MKDSILPIHATCEKDMQRRSSLVHKALDPKTLTLFLWNAKAIWALNRPLTTNCL